MMSHKSGLAAPEKRRAEAPYLIGIAGPSCAGKTKLAACVSLRLAAPVLHLDGYYRDLSRLPAEERSRINFDEPEALDRELFLSHLAALAQGREIARPVYDFSAHVRTDRVERVRPARFVIAEGLFLFLWERARSLFRTRVYVDLGDEICLRRRIERDVRERGRTPESVRRQFEETVRPMAARYVRPGRAFADLVIAGDGGLESSVEAVLAHVFRNCGK